MPKLEWDKSAEKFYECGVDRVALYLEDSGNYPTGIAWSGVTKINETSDGAEANDFYADNVKYASIRSAENFKFTIEAYQYPDDFAMCDGSAELVQGVYIGQQNRKTFGLAYRTLVGNDDDGIDHGYKIHLVYGATASPTERSHDSVNDSPEPISMSWECSTIPVAVTDFKPVSHIVIDSRKADPTKLKEFENTIWLGESPTLPLPNEVKGMLTPEVV